MKPFDMNFIKLEKLFQDDLYREVYNKSKQYENLLPEYVNLGNVYIKNFVNFEPSTLKHKFIPNEHARLSILIGCKEYLKKDLAEHKKYKELYLYFHEIVLNDSLSVPGFLKNEQFIQTVICDVYNENTKRYKKSEDFFFALTNIKLFKSDFQKLIYDYLDEYKIMDKLNPEHYRLEQTYINKDYIEVPF